MNNKYISIALSAFCWSTLFTHNAFAQSVATLTIVSPADGTSVTSGQVINVTVAATNTALIKQEGIIGEDPLGDAGLQTAATNLSFSMTIPATINPGQYHIRAVGGLNGGGDIESPPVSLMVKPGGGSITSLNPELSSVVLKFPGAQSPIIISDQNSRIIDPQFLTYSSSNTDIVTAGKYGILIGQKSGQAQITVGYSDGSVALSRTIGVNVIGGVRGDLNGDGQVNISDLNILTSYYLNTPVHGPNDARDLNGDGVIDEADARILASLCSPSACAFEASSIPPVAPTGLAAVAGNGQVVLNWTASSAATSYDIYGVLTSGEVSPIPLLPGVTSTKATITGLANGTTYFLTVRAVNAAGSSQPSNEANATPTTSSGGSSGGASSSSSSSSSGSSSGSSSSGSTGGGGSSGSGAAAPVVLGMFAVAALLRRRKRLKASKDRDIH